MQIDETWVPVKVAKATVLHVEAGRATIRWSLEGGANHEWIVTFIPEGTRRGSGAYILGGPDPVIDSNGLISWEVPEGDVEDADSFVKQSVEATNKRFLVKLDAERQRIRREQESVQRTAATAEELQKKLDDLNR